MHRNTITTQMRLIFSPETALEADPIKTEVDRLFAYVILNCTKHSLANIITKNIIRTMRYYNVYMSNAPTLLRLQPFLGAYPHPRTYCYSLCPFLDHIHVGSAEGALDVIFTSNAPKLRPQSSSSVLNPLPSWTDSSHKFSG